MQLDTVMYAYIILRFNKQRKDYRKIKIYYDGFWARQKLMDYKRQNKNPNKYDYRLERYKLTRVEDNDF